MTFFFEPGFEGDVCEVNIDDCPGHQCQNEGKCVDGVDMYTCDCVPGFTGLRWVQNDSIA